MGSPGGTVNRRKVKDSVKQHRQSKVPDFDHKTQDTQKISRNSSTKRAGIKIDNDQKLNV